MPPGQPASAGPADDGIVDKVQEFADELAAPSNALHAFEAARHISVNEATAELSVTPGTVSRRCPG
jgi:hypothetical protein